MPIVNVGLRRNSGGVGGLKRSADLHIAGHTAIPIRGAVTPSFTRATVKNLLDHEGREYQALAGEWCFWHVNRVRNLWGTTSTTLTNGANNSMSLSAGTYIFSMGAGTGTATFSGTGGATGTLAASAAGRVSVTKTITAGTLVVTASVADLADLQVEDRTGASNTTDAMPYVSVGALDYRSTQNPLYLSLPGTTGRYASTANIAANTFSGSFEIAVKFLAATSHAGTLVSKDDTAKRNYLLVYDLGSIYLRVFDTAGTSFQFTSVTSPFPVGTVGYIKVVLTWALAGNVSCAYYSSTDGVTWTQVSDTKTIAASGNALNTADTPLLIGDRLIAGLAFNGNIYEVNLGASVATPVVDFNPHRDAVTPTGTITSSTTGEVWTLNDASSVIRSAAYHSSMVDGVKTFPTDYSGNALPTSEIATFPQRGHHVESAATQIIGTTADIRDMTTANWTLGATMTRARTSVGIDGGTNLATRLTGGAAAATNIITYLVTAAATSRTYSAYVKRITGTGPVRITQDNFATSTDISSQLVSGRYVLVQLNQTQLNAVMGFKIDTNGDAIDVDVNQFEAGAFASSRILTGAATRDADVASYTDALIGQIKTLATGFWRPAGVATAGGIAGFSDGTTTNRCHLLMTDATVATFNGVVGGVLQWAQNASNAYTPSTQSKMAQSWATNNIKMDKDGTAQAADTTATTPVVTQLEIGHFFGTIQLNGAVGPTYGWTRLLSQSELGAVDR